MEREDFSRLRSDVPPGDVFWPLVLSLVLCLAVIAFVAVPLFAVTDEFRSPTEADQRRCERQGNLLAERELGHTGSADLIDYRAEQVAERCKDRSLPRHYGAAGD